MADLDHPSDDASVDSRGPSIDGKRDPLPTSSVVLSEENSQSSKVGFSEDEETLIARMFNLLGEKWTLIAGRIPGRTAEEIEKYWTSRCSSSSGLANE